MIAKKLKKGWKKLRTQKAQEVFLETRNCKGRIIQKAMKKQYQLLTEAAFESRAQM